MTEGRRFTHRNEGFVCVHCGLNVPPAGSSCRNHCPRCLHSLHVDVYPGDRAADCRGVMVPVRIAQHSRKGWRIIHRCERCGIETQNILLLEDRVFPDSLEAVLALMRKGD
ncbi:MAG: RNHCP domain-containing protein [Alicyclobacillus sp.]|nr:RNHCP domain-containing protein [Alicyclobacillus sp.]